MKLNPVLSTFAFAMIYAAIGQPAWAESASQWAYALRNTGSEGTSSFRGYTSKSACDKYKDGGGRCELIFPSCGASGVPVYSTMWVIEIIADYSKGDTIAVYSMNGDDLGDTICHGKF